MKTFFLITLPFLVLVLAGCTAQKKKDYLTVRIKLDCIAQDFLDTLDNVLLTNYSSDFGGREKYRLLADLFYPKRIYIKKLVRSPDGYFYVDSVRRGEYFYFYFERLQEGTNFFGMKRKNDFSQVTSDTSDQVFCIELN